MRSTKVIIFGIDGLDCSNAWPKNKKYAAKIPTINRLRRKGLYGRAKIDDRNWSAPNWEGMFTGSPSSVHGVHDNKCYRGKRLETFFKLVKEYDKKREIGIIYDWDMIGCYVESEVFSFKVETHSSSETVQQALDIVNTNIPDCMYIHFKTVDQNGHQHGAGSKEYRNAIEEVDQSIKTIIDRVKTVNKEMGSLKDNIYYIVLSDHGHRIRAPYGHSTNKYKVPFIIVGPGIKHREIGSGVRNGQLATVVARIFKFPCSYQWVYKESPFLRYIHDTRKKQSKKRRSNKKKSKMRSKRR